MKNQNSLKRMTQKYLFSVLILLLLPSFASAAGTSLPAAELKATTKPLQDVKVQQSPLQKQGSQLLNPQNAQPASRNAEAAAKPGQGVQIQKSPLQKRSVRSLTPQSIRPLSRSTGITAESLRDAKVHKSPLQRQGTILLDPQKTKPVLRSAITHLEIGTESDGRWYWEATIKNTGNVELDEQDVTVQGYKFSSFQSTWTAATGSIIGSKSFLPEQSRVIKNYWSRCCMTDKLKIELRVRDKKSHSVLDTRTLTSLVFSPSQYKPLDVRVKQIEWNATTRSWRATLKNFSQFTVKLTVIGVFHNVANMGTFLPANEGAGSDTITLSPEGETSTMWLSPGYGGNVPGNSLNVFKVFLMSENDCTQIEGPLQCGYIGEADSITIPNSDTVFTLF